MFIVDEVGKMELLSPSFLRCVRRALDLSPCPLLGTIPLPRGRPAGVVAEVRSRTDVKVFMVSTDTGGGDGGGIFGSADTITADVRVRARASRGGLILNHACLIQD